MASVIPNRHIEHALELIVSSEMGETASAQQAGEKLAKWRMSKPEHELAYHEAMRQWQLIGNITPELREQFTEPSPVVEKKSNPLNILAITTLLICGGILAKTGVWYWHQPIFEQSIHTNIAQIQQVDLPDGTHLDINAHSDLSVRLYRQKREVTLNNGEVRFAVSHNANAPFDVHTREGDVQVVGTVFTVADRGRSVNVTVEEGHVRFQSKLASNTEVSKPGEINSSAVAKEAMPYLVDLYADEYLVVRNGQHGTKTYVNAADAAAWRDGWLVFNNVPLEDAIPEINAYRRSPIVLGSYKTSQLRLTGRFLANDNQQLDKALPKILPVQIKGSADGTTLVTAR